MRDMWIMGTNASEQWLGYTAMSDPNLLGKFAGYDLSEARVEELVGSCELVHQSLDCLYLAEADSSKSDLILGITTELYRTVTVPLKGLLAGAQRPDAGDTAARRPPEAMRERFERLRRQWLRERGPTSSVTQMAMCPSYQGIIGMGPGVVPLILQELERRPDHWFWALKAITGVNPIAQDQRGRMHEMAKAWLEWASAHGL